MIMRYNDLSTYFKETESIIFALEDYPEVNFRYLIKPSSALPTGKLPINFERDNVEKLINFGFADAAEIVKQGKGAGFA